MSITLIWWLVLIGIAAEFGAVAYRRRNRYPRFVFNAWAPTLYALMICGDLLLGALLTALIGSGQAADDQRAALLGWAVAAGLAALALAALTRFFRWVTNSDITDIPD